jgi:hypothetical protein
MAGPRERFRSRVEALIDQFEAAIRGSEWVSRRYPKRFRDEAGRVEEIPALYLQKGAVNLLLDPIGDDVPGAEGVVDLYLMPTYDPEASLYFEGGQWVFHYGFPPDSSDAPSGAEAHAFAVSDESIPRVLNAIADHAVPSV